jgi:4-hydroxybenzoate polyprenyltransferase
MGATAIPGVTWPVALRLGRVSNLPTVWTNVLAGIVLAGAPVAPRRTLGLMLAFSLFYVGGMYLNDAFDAGFDRLNRPGRPIPSGAVTRSTVFGVGAALIGGGLLLVLALGGVRGFAGGVALAVMIVVYDVWHKGNPVGPVLMGLCRALVYVTAALAVTGVLRPNLLAAAAIALCYLVGLTYVAKQEHVKQLSGPRVVSVLIAGICLLDAAFIATAGQPRLAVVAALGFPLTLLFQRSIPGT